jgi:hypothetical protein
MHDRLRAVDCVTTYTAEQSHSISDGASLLLPSAIDCLLFNVSTAHLQVLYLWLWAHYFSKIVFLGAAGFLGFLSHGYVPTYLWPGRTRSA